MPPGSIAGRTGDPLRYLAEEAAGYAAEGFDAVKLKVGFGVAEDAATVTRGAGGDRARISA